MMGLKMGEEGRDVCWFFGVGVGDVEGKDEGKEVGWDVDEVLVGEMDVEGGKGNGV